MTAHSTPLARAYDTALNLSALADMLSQELHNRFSHDRDTDKPDIAAIASLLSDRLAAHRDSLEALVDGDLSRQPPRD